MAAEPIYTIGVDFGTLACRAVLADTADGREIVASSHDYPHGVMDRRLPNGKTLPPDWALQHPGDYLQVLYKTIPEVIQKAGVPASRIAGLGLDFTASTVMPVKGDGTPLCFFKEYENEPHAYAKLWKHHAAQDQATRMTEAALARGESFLDDYGGKISSEWFFPKLWQLLEEAPELYDETDFFIEAADWMAWQLTGVQTRNACCAGYKALWNKRRGYPSPDYLKALDPRLKNVVFKKMTAPVLPSGHKAGALTQTMAARLGLNAGVAVSVPLVDGHICMPAVGIEGPGTMMGILGTSACFMLLHDKEVHVKGICGVVEDGLVPGYLGYEMGLTCMGDHFAWAADCLAGEPERGAAREAGLDIHAYLTREAAKLRPGQSGLLALDWWNGNRSVLTDVRLTGLLLGMTLQTTCPEIYRALIEATAYGARMIVETYRHSGIAVTQMCAAGGIAFKNELAMQIYADVLNMPIHVAGTGEASALGSAIFASVAAGVHPTVKAATRAMGRPGAKTYTPIPQNVSVYRMLYEEYARLHDTFGRGGNDVMKRLLHLKAERAAQYQP